MMIAPKTYRQASIYQKMKICNGTGASGTPLIIVWLLDSVLGWGVDLKPASNIHDWMYYVGVHWYDKIIADIVYLANMLIICVIACTKKPLSNIIGNVILLPVRVVVRVIPYFLAVLLLGWFAFYRDKKADTIKYQLD